MTHATLEFSVWQFVRLMVQLEESPPPAPASDEDFPPLAEAWADLWAPLDQELSELAERDFPAYADMMMEQNIIVEDVPTLHVTQAAHALGEVINKMNAALKQTTDPAQRENLEFERGELKALKSRLEKLS